MEKDKKTAMKLIEIAIEETESESKKKSIKEVKKYIRNNWNGIINLFKEEKYICSTEGHISHVLSSRLSSRPMGWSLIGADEIARMRTYRENGGNIKTYYNEQRKRNKKKKAIEKIEKRTIRKNKKKNFGSIDPELMVEMKQITLAEFKWLKNISRYAV